MILSNLLSQTKFYYKIISVDTFLLFQLHFTTCDFYSLLSKRYKEITNAYNDFKFEVNSFELLLCLYLKWFYEKQKNINYCLFCGRFYIPSAKNQKTCHYPKLDNMKKRCDELTSDERYEGSKIIPVKHTKRQRINYSHIISGISGNYPDNPDNMWESCLFFRLN